MQWPLSAWRVPTTIAHALAALFSAAIICLMSGADDRKRSLCRSSSTTFQMAESAPEQQSRRVLAEGKHLRLIQQGHWEYAERTTGNSAVAIVAITGDHRILLAEQYRIPVGTR